MTVLTWPSTIWPKAARLMMQTNQRVNASPFGGSEQAVDMLNDRWMLYVTLPIERFAEAQTVEAFLNSFRGQVNTVNAWHFARPTPNGTMRGSPVTVGTTAQGVGSITMQCTRGRVNLALNTGFSQGVTGAVPTNWIERGLVTGRKTVDATVTSGFCMRVTSTGGVIAATSDVRQAVSGLTVGVNYTVRAKMKRAPGYANSTAELYLLSLASFTLTDDYATYTSSFTATTTSHNVFFGGPNGALYDVSELEVIPTSVADSTTYQYVNTAIDYDTIDQVGRTLLAGDMLGVSPQLFQVSADATVNSSGQITVSIVNRVRTAISAGASVTWNAPTAPFRLLSHSGVAYSGALSEEVTLTLGEAI